MASFEDKDMAKLISGKIVRVSVKNEAVQQTSAVQILNEKVERPEILSGQTYKIKTPLAEASYYVTINNIVLNKGTPSEEVRPYEIFINTKDASNIQWITALTRAMSAVFRKGGDITFLIEEFGSVHDPKGGYFKPGGKWVPSLIAEIGEVVEMHLQEIGMLKKNNVTPFTKGAIACPKCSQLSYVISEGCGTCRNCSYSKCG